MSRSTRSSSTWQALPTEARNRASRAIDTLPLSGVIDLMVRDQRHVLAAVRREQTRLVKAAALVERAFRRGGRIVFVGAGTSGRLGVLEAAEMPPTFGISPSQVLAIMAGGPEAVIRAKEGVEDDERKGTAAVARLRLGRNDVVVGISASGVTPFVRAALIAARDAGAMLVGVTCHPQSAMRALTSVCIGLDTGAEVITGSTRLKAGTATKMALNMLTTAAMVRVGKTYGNLMVDVQINSAKLRDRAVRIIATATGVKGEDAAALLKRAGGHVKTAIVMHERGIPRAGAVRLLRASGDSVRKAIGPRVTRRL